MMKDNEPIAIVGLGGVFPKARTVAEYWKNILEGRDCIVEVPRARWDWTLYYDPDPKAADKTYSKIGGFVEGFVFDSLKYRIPPPVAAQMETTQQLAIAATHQALEDAGYLKGGYDAERTAVVLGNSMGGPKKEATDRRIYAAQTLEAVSAACARRGIPNDMRGILLAEVESALKDGSVVTEDSMPGELSNVIAGRVANAFDFGGPNLTADAACASSLAALDTAMRGLRSGDYDMAVCGGVDQMMSPPAYVKFSKIGALSPDGSRPFDAKANGFVMGEGVGILLLKRLSDALTSGDRIYCVVRAIGSSSDGKGKGITAPNPKGQKRAIERALKGLDYGPEAIGLIEAHGTSTPVGDAVEVTTLAEVFGNGMPRRSVAIGSVKSQIGHLKAAAGAAGLVKTALALHHKVLPPSINYSTPNPKIDFPNTPFYVNTQARSWGSKTPRRANVSAFGFGGTNFHVALEEAPAPGTRLVDPRLIAETQPKLSPERLAKLQGEAFVVTGETPEALKEKLRSLPQNASKPMLKTIQGLQPKVSGSYVAAFNAETAAKLAEKRVLIEAALAQPAPFEQNPIALRAKGVYLSKPRNSRPKIGFLFPGQGSQYVDMMRDLRDKYRVVRETFDEADRVLDSELGLKLSSVVFSPEGATPEQIAQQEEILKATEYTQPAVLTADVAVLRLLRSYGVEADVVCGHSLGEYGALVAAGILTFEKALLAVSSRAKEMAGVKVPDCGKMASVALRAELVEAALAGIPGYVAVANKNCPSQTVIAGETAAVMEALRRFKAQGHNAQEIPVSHAFHSEIVAPAQAPYRNVLTRLALNKPALPILSNVTADYYPADADQARELLVRQIAAPVEFISQVERMYDDGVRLFVECGPKRVLTAFVTSTLEAKKDAVALSSNHPKRGGIIEFNDLLARLAAEGVQVDPARSRGHYEPSFAAWAFSAPEAQAEAGPSKAADHGFNLNPVVVSGVSVGAPGSWDAVFRDSAAEEILNGHNLIEKLPEAEQEKQVEKNVVRLIKSESGDHRMEKLSTPSQVIKLAARAGEFDLEKEFAAPGGFAQALDRASALAMAAGILALKDAGIPLVRTYKKTSTGSSIPTGWKLPEALREETGVIFASAFPGVDSLVDEVSRHLADKFSGKPLRELDALYQNLIRHVKDAHDKEALQVWHAENLARLKDTRGEDVYQYNRDFLLKTLTMGHSQMSQWIGARGPSFHMNTACASTTASIGLAEDWIRLGRAKRVVIIAGDDITGKTLQEWHLTGFLAAGAATTEAAVSRAALPFDRRRHGMIVGMGAAGLVIEDGMETTKRGSRALAEVLSTEYANSAFHATRLDTRHIAEVMDRLVAKAEKRHGVERAKIAAKALFMSHETYTPARGGSASAEVEALKHTFGAQAGQVLVVNTKGFTGHTMGASLEDPIAILAMVNGKVPPIANYKEADPELAGIRLSDGGEHDLEFALRLAAGFGSQIAMTFMRRLARKGEARVADPARYQDWLRRVSGQAEPRLEVVQNTLRVAEGTPTPEPQPAVQEEPRRPAVAATAPAAHKASESKPQASHAAVLEPSVAVTRDPAAAQRVILDIVAEKTGYPMDMLQLDLDMEADLGIDTVKQAEIFGIIRERYQIAPVEGLSLKDYPTLGHLIRFVQGGAQPVSAAAVAVETAPAPSAPVIAAPPAAGPAPAVPSVDIQDKILALVAQKTGYPAEMLQLDLDMEADLGIDTVKQAEIFGMIRETFALPPQQGLALKDYPTLRHLIQYVASGTATTPSPSVPLPQGREGSAEKDLPRPLGGEGRGEGVSPFRRWLIRPVEQPIRAPGTHRLGPKPVLIVSEDDAVSQALQQAFKAAGVSSYVIGARELPQLRHVPIQGLVHSLDARSLFVLAKGFQSELNAEGAFLLALTRMDGQHGFAGGANPALGAVTGLTKALRKELSKARVKALDFAPGMDAQAVAEAILAEARCGDPQAEIGYRNGKRWTLSLQPAAAPRPEFDPAGKSILVTGGGMGLGAELAKRLAAYKTKLTILGRTAPDARAAGWSALSADQLKMLKQAMWQEIKAREAKPTPVLLEREYAKVAKAVELHRNLEAMRQAGADVRYEPCDVAAPDDLEKTLARVGTSFDVVIHAAGIEDSRLLADKTEEAFDRVFAAKAAAAETLAALIPSARWLFFSSVTARFGNIGQTDYAAANDALVKLALSLRARGQWACAVDLTAFSDIGMATRGGVETFLKAQGVEFLDPKTGIAMILDELLGSDEGEVLLSGNLGSLDADGQMKLQESPAAPAVSLPRPLGGEGRGEGVNKSVTEKRFSLESDPYLKDHAIAGTPYVPGVMGLQLFREAAAKALGSEPAVLKDVRFELPIKLLRQKPIAVRVITEPSGGDLALRIESDFVSPQGIKLGAPRAHFRATALPGPAAERGHAVRPASPGFYAVPAEAIYKAYFHGPGFQVLKGVLEVSAASVTAEVAPPPASAGAETVRGLPRVIEALFQACGYRDLHCDKKMTLPDGIEQVAVYAEPASAAALFARAAFRGKDAAGKSVYDAELVDASGKVYVALTGYRMVPVS